jgi:sugar O-acyltransferase (sialic acid O-acetyltransferase NeuD family)
VKVVLVGGGGHASDILSILEAQGFDKPVGVVADDKLDLGRFAGRGVTQWGLIDDLGRIGATHYVMAIGYSEPRRAVAARVAAFGLTPLTVIHPRASVTSSAVLGAGAVIMAGAVVSAMARLGDHVCIHHNSVVGHDCRLDDFATVLPGACISGGGILREACLVGSGAVVAEGRIVGAGAVIGAGSVVTHDVPPGVTAMGMPARWS